MEAIVLDQIAILLTGVIAVWLTQDKRESWRRWHARGSNVLG
jgi:hypothetical protein